MQASCSALPLQHAWLSLSWLMHADATLIYQGLKASFSSYSFFATFLLIQMSVHVSPQAGPSRYRYLQQDHGRSQRYLPENFRPPCDLSCDSCFKHAISEGTKSVTSMYLALVDRLLISKRMLIALHAASLNSHQHGCRSIAHKTSDRKKDELSKVQRIQRHKVSRECRCAYLFFVELTAYSKKSTISSREIQNSVTVRLCRTHCLLEEVHYHLMRNSNLCHG